MYLPHFFGQCEIKYILMFNEDDKGVLIRSKEAEYIRGETTEASNNIVSYIELLDTTNKLFLQSQTNNIHVCIC